jgi:hypothetical protein
VKNESNLWVGSIIPFDDDSPNSFGIFQNRQSKFPNESYPPFSDIPALNFAFLETCHAGAEGSEMVVYLYPFYNGYGQYFEDQAVIGCKQFFNCSTYYQFSLKYFQLLLPGNDVADALNDTIQYCIDNSIPVVVDPISGVGHVPAQTDFRIVGDDYSTIHTVYDPDGVRTSPYWREVFYPDWL